MTVARDDRWIADARDRASRGEWERTADEIFAELRVQAPEARDAASRLPPCPACAARPPMLKFPRYEAITVDPILYCATCYGFWAVGDSLARGVADPGYIHPALEAALAPRRCKKCFGTFTDENVCRRCGDTPALLNCPACSKPMERHDSKGVLLDQCPRCNGTWFDTGEINAVYKLERPQGLAASTVDEHAADDAPPAWLLAAQILGRLFVPFL